MATVTQPADTGQASASANPAQAHGVTICAHAQPDTADGAPFLYDAGLDWSNWRRGTDLYHEGELLWLGLWSRLVGLRAA